MLLLCECMTAYPCPSVHVHVCVLAFLDQKALTSNNSDVSSNESSLSSMARTNARVERTHQRMPSDVSFTRDSTKKENPARSRANLKEEEDNKWLEIRHDAKFVFEIYSNCVSLLGRGEEPLHERGSRLLSDLDGEARCRWRARGGFDVSTQFVDVEGIGSDASGAAQNDARLRRDSNHLQHLLTRSTNYPEKLYTRFKISLHRKYDKFSYKNPSLFSFSKT